MRSCGIHLRKCQFHRKCSRYLSLIWVWKILIQDYSCISQGLITYFKPFSIVFLKMSMASQPWLRLWIGTIKAPSHYLNHCWARCHIASTHCSLGKMTDISQTVILNTFPWMDIFNFKYDLNRNVFPRNQIDSTWALVQEIAWYH